jgi:hypothetical protein
MEVTGIIQEVFEPQYGTSKAGMDWAKREFLIVTQGQYPKHILFTISGKDRVQQFILHKDMPVKVQFDVDCREYNERWYNTLTAWKVEMWQPA